MLFDGAIAALSLARIHMAAGEIPQKGAAISKAIDLISNGLLASLDMEAGGELAERLAALYDYMTQRLLFANLKNSLATLDEVVELLTSLRDAWAQIAPNEQAAA
jgi:flagellar protein FliS